MPIDFDSQIKPVSEEEFHERDYGVMEAAFSTHNELGCLCDEKIYQNELLHRCRQNGFAAVQKEVPIIVSHKEFSKTFYMDMLVDHGFVYELKAIKEISNAHRKQVLNYLMLTGLNFGKIINFGRLSVQHEFVSTKLTPERRREWQADDRGWTNLDDDSAWLKNTMQMLIDDWGTFLDISLYHEAVTVFRGGDEAILERIPVSKDSRELGFQNEHMLNPQTAFRITAFTKKQEFAEKNIRRLLSHTSLTAIQWINFNHHTVSFKTIKK